MIASTRSRSGCRPDAFTMIELLVAMVVLILLVVLLANIVDSSTKLWRENENRVDAYREARAALNLITSDLRSMLASSNANYFSTNVLGDANGVEPGGLYFLSGLKGDSQVDGSRAELCAIGYYRRWARQNLYFANTNAQDLTQDGYQLFRSIRGSDQTFTNLIGANQPLVDLANPADPTMATPEIVARNIVALEFRLYKTNVSGQVRFANWVSSPDCPVPQMIEVRLTAISDELARRLAGQQDRWNTNDPSVVRNMRTFVSRVSLPVVSTN